MKALTRTRFAERDPLRARDLETALAEESRRRALHVRAVHRAAGVALGFAVGLGRSRHGVVVGPGLAYDRRGRELVSGRTVFVPAPSTDGRYDLALAGGCGLDWTWLEPGSARDELVLARFEVDSGQLGDPDLAPRRRARGTGQRLAAGLTIVHLDTSMTVDTSAGEFSRTPTYFATLADSVAGGARRADETATLLLELANPSPTSFDLLVRAIQSAEGPSASYGEPFPIHWIGVERDERCWGFEPDKAAVAAPLDAVDEYRGFTAVPPTIEPEPS